MPTGENGQDGRLRNMIIEQRGIATEMGTATATAGAATCNTAYGKVTSEALTTAQNVLYTLTITSTAVAAADNVQVTVGNGTNSAGTPMLCTVTPAAGSIVIVIANKHATAVAFNGTLVVSYVVIKAL